MYSRTLVTQTLKGNEKQFEVAIEGSSYRGQLKKKNNLPCCSYIFNQGKGNSVRVKPCRNDWKVG